MQITDLDERVLTRSLRSVLCPACAGAKRLGQTLCRRDYRRLPVELRNALYRRVGAGYLEAVTAALTWLRAKQAHLPDEPAPPVGGARSAGSAAQPSLFPEGEGARMPR